MGETLLNVAEENMLTEGISRLQWECTGERIHSAWKDQGSFIKEVSFDLALKDDEVSKGIFVQ